MTFSSDRDSDDEEFSLMDVYWEAQEKGLSEDEVEKEVDKYIDEQVEIYGEEWLKTYRDD